MDFAHLLPIASLLASLLTLAAVIFRGGAWKTSQEDAIRAVNSRLDQVLLQWGEKLTTCRANCDTRMTTLEQHGTDYAHQGLHSLRNDLQQTVLSIDVKYARKESVEQEYRALRELVDTKLSAINTRLEAIESRLEASA